jgi:hypothetical protein
VVVVGPSVVGVTVVVGATVVELPDSSHLPAGGSSALPVSVDASAPVQWATAVKVIVPVVSAGRSKWPVNWLWCSAK